jgi:hypothetical protein
MTVDVMVMLDPALMKTVMPLPRLTFVTYYEINFGMGQWRHQAEHIFDGCLIINFNFLGKTPILRMDVNGN